MQIRHTTTSNNSSTSSQWPTRKVTRSKKRKILAKEAGERRQKGGGGKQKKKKKSSWCWHLTGEEGRKYSRSHRLEGKDWVGQGRNRGSPRERPTQRGPEVRGNTKGRGESHCEGVSIHQGPRAWNTKIADGAFLHRTARHRPRGLGAPIALRGVRG